MKYRALLLLTALAQAATRFADSITVAAVRTAEKANAGVLAANSAAYEVGVTAATNKSKQAWAVAEALERALNQAEKDAQAVESQVKGELNALFAKHREVTQYAS